MPARGEGRGCLVTSAWLQIPLKGRTNPSPHVHRASSATSQGAPPLLIFGAPSPGINPVWHNALIPVPSHSSSPKAFLTPTAHSRSAAAGRAGPQPLPRAALGSPTLREPPPEWEGTNSLETPAVQNISHLLVHTAKHSLNMHSTLIGHISTGSQVPEQSSGAGQAGSRRQKHSFGRSAVRGQLPVPVPPR